MKHLLESGYFWFVLSIALLLFGIGLTIWFWCWLHPKAPTTVSNSETLRNVGLLIGGMLAFIFALWRGWVSERQAEATRSQAESALRQAETAEQTLLNERYQRGAEMLVSRVLAVRMEGIRSLEELAEDQPDSYFVRVTQLIGDFVRNPTGIEEDQNGPNLG